MRFSYFLFALLVTGLISALWADEGSDKKSDWPQWRGATQNGSSSTGALELSEGQGLQTVWKNALGQGYSSVSVADGRAITMFTDGESDLVIAFDAENGNELWRYRTGPAYMGKGGSHNGPSSTPLIDGDLVFALERKGKLIALNAKDGSEAWSRHIVQDDNATEPFHGFTTAPVVYGDVLVVETGGTEGKSISGYDKFTGKLRWQNGDDVVNYQSPILTNIGGDTHVICAGNNSLLGVNLEDGSKLWEFQHLGRAGSINPLQIGKNKILLTTNSAAQLVQVDFAESGFVAKELWQSRHLKRSFNVPVFHDGYLYGYSGQFITCVDAENGETVWKSREPGDGFIILVDGNLVVLTKRGSLHIAPATPEGYQEKANLKMFEGIAWTPPSFANGRIFARSLDEIASVQVVNTANAISIAKVERKPAAPNSDFAKFVRKVEKASNKEALVEAFMAEQKSFPVIEGDNLVHFVYHGEVEDIVIGGDMFDIGEEETMFRVDGTDLYYFTQELPSDAHLAYQIVRNYEERITDPLNPKKVNGFNGEESEFAMPDWKGSDTWLKKEGVPSGKLVEETFASKTLSDERTLQVYLPAGYENSSKRYPTAYVNYGRMALEFGNMPTVLDNLIAAGEIDPVVVVFIYPTRNRFQEYARDAKAQYSEMITQELVPHIDNTYRTVTAPQSRLIMGGDEGGYSAIYTAVNYPAVFSMVGGQSSHLHSQEGQELRDKISQSETLPIRFYMDWGKFDYRSVSGDYDWGANNRNFVKLLKEKGYSVESREVNEGFGWTSWRTRTDVLLKTFFAKKS